MGVPLQESRSADPDAVTGIMIPERYPSDPHPAALQDDTRMLLGELSPLLLPESDELPTPRWPLELQLALQLALLQPSPPTECQFNSH